MPLRHDVRGNARVRGAELGDGLRVEPVVLGELGDGLRARRKRCERVVETGEWVVGGLGGAGGVDDVGGGVRWRRRCRRRSA